MLPTLSNERQLLVPPGISLIPSFDRCPRLKDTAESLALLRLNWITRFLVSLAIGESFKFNLIN